MLVNIGPAKPQRQLTETERLQLLSPNVETADLGARTPPHRLVLETSFTDLQPETEETIQGKIDHYQSNQSWEYNNGASVIDIGKICDGERKEWMQMAPLASPETLSDVSSVSSKEGSHQKLNNGNRLSWTGVSTMEPIAQSPAVQKPTSDSVRTYMNKNKDVTSIISSPILEHENYPVSYKVITEATVEANTFPVEPCSTQLMDPSRLCLDGLEENIHLTNRECMHFGADSTYASTSTEQTIERLFTPHEPKRVTFEMFDKQRIAREVSEDSMYNSGESFVPTYPEYSNQQEYGNHGYMYTPCGYTNLSPASSPIIGHSVSDVQLFKLMEETYKNRTHERINIPNAQEVDPIDEDPIVTSSPIKPHHKNLTYDVESIPPNSNRGEYQAESSL